MKQSQLLKFLILLIILSLTFQSCLEKNTEDPIKTYLLWSGEEPSDQVSILHGKYWESAHWSKEYIMYIELNASPLWRKEFIKQNDLIKTSERQSIPSDAPVWFKPGKNFNLFIPSGFNQGSQYYEDTVSGKVFIYEIQL